MTSNLQRQKTLTPIEIAAMRMIRTNLFPDLSKELPPEWLLPPTSGRLKSEPTWLQANSSASSSRASTPVNEIVVQEEIIPIEIKPPTPVGERSGGAGMGRGARRQTIRPTGGAAFLPEIAKPERPARPPPKPPKPKPTKVIVSRATKSSEYVINSLYN